MEFDKERFKTPNPLARVIVLTADKFEDFELFVPYFRLMEEGVAVDVAAPAKETLTGENGYLFENVDLTFDEVDPQEYDLLFVPGGHPHGAPTTVRNNEKAQETARAFFKADKPVAAICHGPYLLVSADLVAGRRLTSFWGDGVPDEIRAAGGIYVDEDVVVDGNLITSRWPMDLPAFMQEVMRALRKRGKATTK
ncbi:MAG: type 1 glutamine amidotransferase domain-containing protein [Thermoleophilia bacterium]